MKGGMIQLYNAETYQVGQQLQGFVVQQVVPVPEYQLTAVELEHVVTGAQHLHVARKDSNNVFWYVALCTNVSSAKQVIAIEQIQDLTVRS